MGIISVAMWSCNKQKNEFATPQCTENASVKNIQHFFEGLNKQKKTRDSNATVSVNADSLEYFLEAALNINLCTYYYNSVVKGTDVFKIELPKTGNNYQIDDLKIAYNAIKSRVLNFKNTFTETNKELLSIDLEFETITENNISINARGVVATVGSATPTFPYDYPTVGDEPDYGPGIRYRYWPSFYTNIKDDDLKGFCKDPKNGNRISNMDNTWVGDMSAWGRYYFITYLGSLGYFGGPVSSTPLVSVDNLETVLMPIPASDNIYRTLKYDMIVGNVEWTCIQQPELNYYYQKSNVRILNYITTNNRFYNNHFWTHLPVCPSNPPNYTRGDYVNSKEIVKLTHSIMINKVDAPPITFFD